MLLHHFTLLLVFCLCVCFLACIHLTVTLSDDKGINLSSVTDQEAKPQTSAFLNLFKLFWRRYIANTKRVCIFFFG